MGCACTGSGRTVCYSCSTADLGRCTRGHGGGIGAEYDVGVKDGEEGFEVTATGGGEEGVHNFSLTVEIGAARGVCSLDTAACAARELPCRGGGTSDDGSDVVEGQVEHVVQHEGEPFGRCQGFEDD